MTKKASALATRMKAYEHNARKFLNKKEPVAFRLDLKAAHTFTRGMNRPYDDRFIECMNYAALKLAEEMEGLGCPMYLQSDECSGILLDVKRDSSQAWFDYNVQKLQSVMASIFSVNFNLKIKEEFKNDDRHKNKIVYCDCRVWNIPFTQIVDYYKFRQFDCQKNATSMIGRYYYSDKQLFKKNTGDIQKMLLDEHSVDVNNSDHVPTYFSRGRCVYQVQEQMPNPYLDKYPKQEAMVTRNKWIVDENIPVFKDDKNFIEKYFNNYFTQEDSDIVYGVLEKFNNEFENFDENPEIPFPVFCNELYSLERSQKTKVLKELDLVLKIRYPEYNIESVNDDCNKSFGYMVSKK